MALAFASTVLPPSCCAVASPTQISPVGVCLGAQELHSSISLEVSPPQFPEAGIAHHPTTDPKGFVGEDELSLVLTMMQATAKIWLRPPLEVHPEGPGRSPVAGAFSLSASPSVCFPAVVLEMCLQCRKDG